jgi:hypothetical protein
MDFEQEQEFAEPYLIHPELTAPSDKHHVLAIGLLQFHWYKWL